VKPFWPLVVAIAGTNYHPQLTPYLPAGARAVEFGSALGDSGYAKLKAALPWKQGPVRADYYFDAWDGQRFLLKQGQGSLKVRIKLKAGHPHWQISRYVSRDRLAVDALGVKIHVTETWEGRIKARMAILAAADAFFDRLAAGGPPLREAADRVDATYRDLRAHAALPGLNVLDGYLKGKTYKFYPTRFSPAKSRLTATLPGFAGPPVKLMLDTAPEADANGKTVILHELEAEADAPLTEAQALEAAKAIGKLMEQAGLTPKDVERPEVEGWRFVEAKLKGI
jgi:hypothetical protein